MEEVTTSANRGDSKDRPFAQHMVSVHKTGTMMDDNLELWPEWSKKDVASTRRLSNSRGSRDGFRRTTSSFLLDPVDVGGATQFDQSLETRSNLLKGFIMHPSSFRRLSWDLLSVAVITYDLLTMPLQVFGYDTLLFAVVMHWTTTICWTIDIFLTFITGYHDEGIVVCLPSKIALRYLKSHFIMDLTIVCVDWALLSFGGTSYQAVEVARVGKAVRFVRLLRVMRLIRVMKVMTIMNKVADSML